MKTICLITISLLLVIWTIEKSGADDGYFLSLYGGQASDTQFNAIIRGMVEYKDYYLIAGTLSKELMVYKDRVGIEVEGQVVKHIEGQEHWEFNPVLTLRWLPFPWDNKIDTSFAWGNGLSYATEEPRFEIEESSRTDETSQWLYYFMMEMAFVLPEVSNWSIFSRIHHRSSVFGIIDGLFTGSNFVTFGVRYYFN
jgi:hypothetical protein